MPREFPTLPRKADGSLDGGQCLAGTLDVLTIGGDIRLQLIGLIAAERERQAKAAEASKPK